MRWLSAVYSAVYAWPFPGSQSWLSKNISTSLSILTFFFVFSGFFTCAIFSSIPRKSTHQHVWIIWTKPLQVLEPFYLQGFDRGWLCVCAFRLAAWGNYMELLSCRKNKQSFLARQCAADNTCSPSAALSLSELVFQDEPNGPELFWYWCSPENSESQCCISCISWIVCNMHAIFLRYVASRHPAAHTAFKIFQDLSRSFKIFQDLSSNCLSVWPSDSYIWKVNASFECQHLGSSRWSHLNSVWRKRLLHRAPTNVFIVNPTKHSASLGKPTNRLLLQLCSSLYALHMPRWYLCCIITLNNIFNHIEYEPVIHSIIILRSSLRFCEDIGFRAALLHLWLLVPCSWLPWPHRLRGLLNLTSLCSSAICNALRPQQSRFNTSGMFVKDDWGLKTVPLVCYML